MEDRRSPLQVDGWKLWVIGVALTTILVASLLEGRWAHALFWTAFSFEAVKANNPGLMDFGKLDRAATYLVVLIVVGVAVWQVGIWMGLLPPFPGM